MAVDSLWGSVVLFMPCDSSGVVDVTGKTPTLTGGGPVASSTQSLTGGYSLYFDGTDDKATFPASSAWDFSGGNGEISFSIYPTALPGAGNWCRLFLIGANGSASSLTLQISNTGEMQFGVAGGATLCSAAAGTVTVGSGGVFQRYEISLSSGVARIFKDGALVAGPTTITAQSSSSSNALILGYDTVATVNFKYQGYLDRVRLTKSVRHTAAFTDDTNPFPRPMISGVTKNVSSGAFESKAVVALKRSTLAVDGTAVSSAGDGTYTIYPSDFSEHVVMRFDTATYPLVDGSGSENAIIFDRVIPG